MRVLFLNRFFYPDHSATSQMLSDLAFGLARAGYPVTVITSRQLYDAPRDQLAARERIEGVDVFRVWTSRFGRSNLALRAIDYLTFYLSASWALLSRVRRGDVVVAKTDPPMISVLAAPIAKLRGALFVNWLQDIFPEVAKAVEVGGAVTGWTYRPLQSLRNASLRAADMNIVIGDRMAELVMSLGVDNSRLRIIPNWTNCGDIRPIDQGSNKLRSKWELGSAFVVGYSGNLGRAHEIDTILAAAASIEQKRGRSEEASHIVWLFVGGGALFEPLKREAQVRKLTSLQFQNYQPREILAEALSVANVHLVSLKAELEGLIVPSKFYGVAAAGRPTIFIGDRDGEIARYLTRIGCGFVVDIGDGEGLAKRILELAENGEAAKDMGRRAREYCEQHFDRKQAALAWDAVLTELKVKKNYRESRTMLDSSAS
ncbi:Glycosyltransferase involved in cell wall bisynthesis [Hyphomicrobium facile]|uniref:Glycosyltransferase involved in cell wall bisynthesis n=2 Tax=Hyphomicrobium facile TaxID=51670 RepID=A0A1I7NDH2_9HYPH|nr:Glycosyltransferase involved in cell wall bisynthesis [Hyphomicrobium facile]